MNSTNQKNQWWSTFFSGLITDVQIKMNNPEQTQNESAFLKDVLNLPTGATVADVPCGDGRLSIALAKLGYSVRGIDISPEIIATANQAAKTAKVPAEFRIGDMKDLPWTSELDGTFCFGNSFAYFDDEGNEQFLRQVVRALKPKGRFVLQSNLIAESILTKPMSRSWYSFGETLFLHSASYESKSATLTSEYTLVQGEKRETKVAHYRVYQLRNLLDMMSDCGLQIAEVFGSLQKEPFKLGDPAIYILAKKAMG